MPGKRQARNKMGEYRNILNEKVVDYLIRCYRPINDDFAAFREKAEMKNVPIILPDAETLILNIIRIKKPAKILEIGTAAGYSACCFAHAGDCDVVTIEKDEQSALDAVNNIREMGLDDKIEVLCGDGEEVTETLKDTFDFVFIDAAKSHYKRFFDAAIKHAGKNAVVVCDNVLFKARVASDEYDETGRYKTNIRKMREFIDYLLSLDYADTSIIPAGDGLAVTVIK